MLLGELVYYFDIQLRGLSQVQGEIFSESETIIACALPGYQ